MTSLTYQSDGRTYEIDHLGCGCGCDHNSGSGTRDCIGPAYPDYEQAAEVARRSGGRGEIYVHGPCGSWHIRFEPGVILTPPV